MVTFDKNKSSSQATIEIEEGSQRLKVKMPHFNFKKNTSGSTSEDNSNAKTQTKTQRGTKRKSNTGEESNAADVKHLETEKEEWNNFIYSLDPTQAQALCSIMTKEKSAARDAVQLPAPVTVPSSPTPVAVSSPKPKVKVEVEGTGKVTEKLKAKNTDLKKKQKTENDDKKKPKNQKEKKITVEDLNKGMGMSFEAWQKRNETFKAKMPDIDWSKVVDNKEESIVFVNGKKVWLQVVSSDDDKDGNKHGNNKSDEPKMQDIEKKETEGDEGKVTQPGALDGQTDLSNLIDSSAEKELFKLTDGVDADVVNSSDKEEENEDKAANDNEVCEAKKEDSNAQQKGDGEIDSNAQQKGDGENGNDDTNDGKDCSDSANEADNEETKSNGDDKNEVDDGEEEDGKEKKGLGQDDYSNDDSEEDRSEVNAAVKKALNSSDENNGEYSDCSSIEELQIEPKVIDCITLE